MTSLRIRNKALLKSSQDSLPELGELVIGYQIFTPIFAVRLDINGEPEWFEVTFKHGPTSPEVEYRLIEDDEPAVVTWAAIPSVIEVG